jgi:2'-5' RNA ligase
MSGSELESAPLLRVPAAEAAVGAQRARLDSSARDGVPAHVTVLYPFLPPAEIGSEVLAELSRLFAAVPRFSFSLDRVRWFGESVVWLGPSDESPFRALTGLAVAAHPSCLPYRGAHEDVVPHLTIGHLGGPAELRAAARGGPPAAADHDGSDRGDPDGRPDTGAVGAARPMGDGGILPPGVVAERFPG